MKIIIITTIIILGL